MRHYYSTEGQDIYFDPDTLVEFKEFTDLTFDNLYCDGKNIYQKIGTYSWGIKYLIIGHIVDEIPQLRCENYSTPKDSYTYARCPTLVPKEELKDSHFWKSDQKIYCSRCTIELQERPERDLASQRLKNLAHKGNIDTLRRVMFFIDSEEGE